jgi:hypothetical protein
MPDAVLIVITIGGGSRRDNCRRYVNAHAKSTAAVMIDVPTHIFVPVEIPAAAMISAPIGRQRYCWNRNRQRRCQR